MRACPFWIETSSWTTEDGRQTTDEEARSLYLSSVVRRPSSAFPPERRTGRRLGLAVVRDGRAVERAVEGGKHAALDEIEGARLAVARARQVAFDRLEEPA